MNEKQIFAENIKRHSQKLSQLLQVYDLAVLANDVQKQHFRDLENKVLQEHEFFASEPCKCIGIEEGDRITSERGTFLLSEEDFDIYQNYCLEKYFKAGLTDENGNYIKCTWKIELDARREFVDFCIENVLPPSMKNVYQLMDAFAKNRIYTIENKLINIFRESFKTKQQ